MTRRGFLLGAGALWCAGPAAAHTLYGQWVVYRRKHLLVGCHRDDMETWTLAQTVKAVLDHALPEAKARIARAPFAGRLASLLGTEQLEIAVLGRDEAVGMAEGLGTFAPYGRVPLRMLVDMGEHVLVARAGFPDRHAWLTTAALLESGMGTPEADGLPFGLHDGARAFVQGVALEDVGEGG